MNKSKNISFQIVFGALLFIAATASSLVTNASGEDLTLHEKITTEGGRVGQAERDSTRTTYWSASGLRQNSSAGLDLILLFDPGKIITIDHSKKSYTELTLAQLQARLEESTSKLGGQNEQLLQMMRQRMGEFASDVTVTGLGEGGIIAGYKTQKYSVKMAPMELEIWSAPDLKIPPTFYDAMKLKTPANPLFNMGKFYDAFKKIQGHVLKNIAKMTVMGMSVTTTSEVTSVEKGSIPASHFQVPEGYRLVEPD